MSVLEIISNENEYINDGCVFVNGNIIGILNPSFIEGTSKEGSLYLSGVHGIEQLKSKSATRQEIWQALIECGAVLFGTEEEVKKVKSLLHDDKWSRTVSYFCSISTSCEFIKNAVDKISSANVLIIGAGGIGSLTAMNLAGSGVGNITIIDGDTIERSNFNRQFFWDSQDIGKYKVEVLKSKIDKRYPDIKVSIINGFAEDEIIRQEAGSKDFCVLTADEPMGVGLDTLMELYEEKSIHFAHAGYVQRYLVMNYNNSNSEAASISWKTNPWFIAPSFAPSNTEIAGVLSSLALLDITAMIDANSASQFTSHWSTTTFPRKGGYDDVIYSTDKKG